MVIVKRKELSFWERLYLPEVVRGLSITMRAVGTRSLADISPASIGVG